MPLEPQKVKYRKSYEVINTRYLVIISTGSLKPGCIYTWYVVTSLGPLLSLCPYSQPKCVRRRQEQGAPIACHKSTSKV